ncbi:helix-turn-helix domain-containing protein, partial [Dysosmobacter welbionis]
SLFCSRTEPQNSSLHIPKEPFINCERLFFRNADAKSLINKINTEFSFTPQMVFFLKSIDRLMWKCICYTIFAARIYSNSS